MFRKAKKSTKNVKKNKLFRFLVAGLRCTGPSWGENIERGTRIFPSHLQQGVRCWCLVFDVEVLSLASRTLVHTFGGRRIETPRGGAPPPTHSWRICDRGLVLAGVLGVLGFLGILAQNLEKIVAEPSQIEARGLKNRVQRLQNRARSLQDAIFQRCLT